MFHCCQAKSAETFWWQSCVVSPHLDDTQWRKKFGRRFRIPCEKCTRTLNRAKELPCFNRWKVEDAAGRNSSPINLLLLGTLSFNHVHVKQVCRSPQHEHMKETPTSFLRCCCTFFTVMEGEASNCFIWWVATIV